MIKNITIENYKLFKSFHLEDIPRILLIGGKNNCGKTSLLEAVFLILDHLDPSLFIKHLKWRKLLTDITSKDPKFLLKPSFYNFNLNQPITFQYTLCPSSTSSVKKIERKISYKFLPFKLGAHKYSNGKQVTQESRSIQTNQSVLLGSIEASYQFEQGDSKFLFNFHNDGIFFDNVEKGKEHLLLEYNLKILASFLPEPDDHDPPLSEIYGELEKNKNTKGVLEALKILEPRLQSLSIIPVSGQPRIYGDIGIDQQVPLSLMGQGMQRLLSILSHIAYTKSRIVLIDEMENGFHHSILPRVWEIIAKHAEANNVQIMATTHSRELAMGAIDDKEGIPEHLRDDFKYMRIDRNGDEFDPKVYDAEMLKSALKMNLAIR